MPGYSPKPNSQTTLNSDSYLQRTKKQSWGNASPQVRAKSLAMSTVGKQVSIPGPPRLAGSINYIL